MEASEADATRVGRHVACSVTVDRPRRDDSEGSDWDTLETALAGLGILYNILMSS